MSSPLWALALAWAVPDIDAPLATGHAGEGVAVVVGVEDYAFLPDVPHARRDASAMTDILALTMGLGADRVTTLATANREQLLQAVRTARAQAGEAPVYVYFAGHGATGPDGELLLVGDDAKADATVFVNRSVSVKDLADLAGPNGVLWLDTCYAGVGRGGQPLIPGARLAVPVYAVDSLGGAQIWTAASPSEVSLPYLPARHGTFTYFLAGGLRGWADGAEGPADGTVTLDELWSWVQQGMRRVEADQTPQRRGPEGDDPALTSGPLEAAPTDLPRVSVARQLPTTPVPGNVPMPAPTTTLVPPFTVDGPNLRDAQGRGASYDELAALGMGPDVAKARKQVKSGRTAATVGLVGAGVGVAMSAAGFVASASSQSNWQSTQDLCDSGAIAGDRCNADEPGTSPLAFIGAGTAVGALLTVPFSIKHTQKARRDLAERANEVLR